MRPDDGFERCLASLYGAALDDARWPAATSLLEEAVGTGGSTLAVAEGFEDDVRLHFARILQRGESRDDLAREYFDVYLPHDEGIPRLRRRPHGELVRVRDLYSEDELKTSPVYNEGLRRMGSREGLLARFDGPDGLRIVWAVGDPVGGGWQSARLHLLERLLPHIHRSVLVRQALAAAEALGAGLAGLLDNERIGVVQLDRVGRVAAANGLALGILRRGDGLRDGDGVLDAWLPADRTRLRRLVARALPSWRGEEPPGGGSMTLQRAAGRSRLAVHVTPVGDAARDFGSRRVAALVLLVDPARRPRIDASRVAKTLGLSPSEARLAALLTEGRKVREIAAAGWRENYVRWLVRQVYGKLGASGQVDVARQVLAVDVLPR